MQTKRGYQARSITEGEFTDIMQHFKNCADLAVILKPELFGEQQPIYAFDHAPWHMSAVKNNKLSAIGITAAQLLPVPPRSPDFQKVIEHVFGFMTQQFQQKLYSTAYDDLHTAAQYRNYVKDELFMQKVTKDQINKDVRSLKQLYKVVKSSIEEGGVAGGWPAEKFT
jgi:hypothetical protein